MHDDIYLTSEPGMIPTTWDVPAPLLWYGVLHENGDLSVKRYHDWMDYKEAGDSDFTRHVTRIFEAPSSTYAIDEAKRLIMTRVRF